MKLVLMTDSSRPCRTPGRGMLPDAGDRRDARHRPRQRPLPDRLHRQQRPRADRAADADVHHRLPLRRAGGERGGSVVRPRPRAAGSARRGRGRRCPAGELRLGFEDNHVSVRTHAPDARAARASGSSSSPPAAWSSACARSREPTRSSGSGPRPRSPTPRFSALVRARTGRAHRTRARARAPAGHARARRRSGRASTRSSPPGRTARCRTPSRATSRSPRTSWS